MKFRLLLLLLLVASACGEGSGSTTGVPTGEVVGTVVAGPTCPVEQQPPDPGCVDRPVPGAVVVVRDKSGEELSRAIADEEGIFVLRLPVGDYLLVPQPVAGLLGTAPELNITVTTPDQLVEVTITYDTGIR